MAAYASSGVSTARSIWPVRWRCTSAPPSSSASTCSPVAMATTRGEVTARHVPAHLDGEVAHGGDERGGPEAGPDDGGGEGDLVAAAGELRHRRQLREAFRAHDVGDPGAAGLPEVHEGHALAYGQVDQAGDASAAHLGGRAPLHRDVVAADHDRPAVDRADAADLAVTGSRCAVLGPHRVAERADLLEGAAPHPVGSRRRVEEAVDVFPDRAFAPLVEAGHGRRAAHLGADPAGPLVQERDRVGRLPGGVVPGDPGHRTLLIGRSAARPGCR